jgi:hypothetical protein
MGNDLPGDGWKYRGRGPGLTGKFNYEACEKRTGLPLVDHPEFASKPEHFVHIACDFWANGERCNELADGDNLRGITKAINGGEIGSLLIIVCGLGMFVSIRAIKLGKDGFEASGIDAPAAAQAVATVAQDKADAIAESAKP